MLCVYLPSLAIQKLYTFRLFLLIIAEALIYTPYGV